MTVTDRRDSKEPGAVLGRVEALTPEIADRAAEIEAARRLPSDLLADLSAAGCFRMLLPESHGGLGADLSTTMQVFETLSRADASVGWTVAIGAGGWIDLVGLPRATFDVLYANGPDVIIAGAIRPSGSATATSGGYRVSGQWGFASGCEHASWLFANCVEDVDGDQRIHTVLFTPAEVDIDRHLARVRPARHRQPRFPCRGGIGSGRADVPDARPRTLHRRDRRSDPAADALRAFAGQHRDRYRPGRARRHRRPRHRQGSAVRQRVPRREARGSTTSWRQSTPSCGPRVALLSLQAEEMWATATDRSEFTLQQRARVRAAAVWATERGGGDRRDGLPRRRGYVPLRRQSVAAPAPRHQCRDPALPRQARHADDGGSDLRRARRRRANLLRAPPRARL